VCVLKTIGPCKQNHLQFANEPFTTTVVKAQVFSQQLAQPWLHINNAMHDLSGIEIEVLNFHTAIIVRILTKLNYLN